MVQRQFVVLSTLLWSVAGGPAGHAGPAPCADDNGDTNGDQTIDLSDAVYALAFQFQGGPAPTLFCRSPGPPRGGCAVDNGDTNGDKTIDLSDAVYALAFQFQGGPTPVPICVQTVFGGDRPVTLKVPGNYDPDVPAPLLFLLHGYTGTGALQDLYFGVTAAANARGMLYAHPDGLVDGFGNNYWNATDACCDVEQTGVDDSGYLRSLITEIEGVYNVDPKRIYFMGHSNGHFMSYRMACDHSDVVAAIAGLAGATYFDDADCDAAGPVHSLHIHGDADATIDYAGSMLAGVQYPGAVESVAYWSGIAGCDTAGDTSPASLDLVSTIAGAETRVTRYATGCSAAGSTELWTIEGGGHVPPLTSTFTPAILDYLLAHPKP